MDKFVVERFIDGEMLHDEIVESDQRLLNERDLDTITLGKDKKLLFVRSAIDTTCGYFLGDDGRWDYGTREKAFNAIKRRV